MWSPAAIEYTVNNIMRYALYKKKWSKTYGPKTTIKKLPAEN